MSLLTEAEAAERSRGSFVERIGIHPPLMWGYVGLLLFMTGDGIESGYLSRYLVDQGFSEQDVALIFTVYGLTAAVAAWFSGALSDLWGPRRVMGAGLGIWAVFEVAFLVLGVAPNHYPTTFGISTTKCRCGRRQRQADGQDSNRTARMQSLGR